MNLGGNSFAFDMPMLGVANIQRMVEPGQE